VASVFTKIINGELPSYKLLEDELTISILTIEPIQLGHTLVIPKSEINHWFDVPQEVMTKIQFNAARLGKALRLATGAPRILTAAIGFEVPHYHLHLVPAWDPSDLHFSKARKRSEEEMKAVQAKILAHL
jgi:histidine triad (HIT) family protein